MFKVGQRVRIKLDAFPGSKKLENMNVRGKIGTLYYLIDNEELWHWEDDSGHTAAPIESELEAVMP